MLDALENGQIDAAFRPRGTKVLWHAPGISPEAALNAAVISKPQSSPNAVNDTMTVHPCDVPTLRPSGYGRAALVNSTRDASPDLWDWTTDTIFDVKGCGVAQGCTPRAKRHATGLLTLAEGLQEVLMEEMVRTLLVHADIGLETARCLALVDLGATGYCPPEYGFPDRQPAVLMMREAHRRPVDNRLCIDEPTLLQGALSLELWLRHLGLTTTKRAFAFRLARAEHGLSVCRVKTEFTVPRDHPVYEDMARHLSASDGPCFATYPNVQFTHPHLQDGRRRIVDFGHFNFLTHPGDPLVLRLRDAAFEWGPSLGPGDLAWLEPGQQATALRSALILAPDEANACLEAYRLPTSVRSRIGWYDVLCLWLALELQRTSDPSALVAAEIARQRAAVECAMDRLRGA